MHQLKPSGPLQELPPLLRHHSSGERWLDAIVHGVAILAALAGGCTLVVIVSWQDHVLKLAAMATYVAGLLAMLVASAAYNLSPQAKDRALLRSLDHAAIFLMIGGTYTPFLTQLPSLALAAAMTVIIWLACLVGIAIKLLRPRLFERLSVGLYLALGWSGLLVLGPLMSRLPVSSFIGLVAGGLLYSIGVLFHISHRLKYQNAIWHIFVVSAASCHYVAILLGVAFVPA